MGSVKDLQVVKRPEAEKAGIGIFEFSDRYSVFDWGEMPDEIPDKGASIAIMTAYFFELLEGKGIKTHYRGIINNNETVMLDSIEEPFNRIEVKSLRVIEPNRVKNDYDYSVYKGINSNYLIPLEFIYRNSIPEGSSFWNRYKSGVIFYDILDEIEPNKPLTHPILDVSTKLEKKDRYLSWEEASEIAGLDQENISMIKRTLLTVNSVITEEFGKYKIINQDGKIECGIDESGELIIVDALGTLDECRFIYNGISLSKEVLRKYYRRTEWFKGIKRAKEKSRMNWKSIVDVPTPELPADIIDIVAQMYKRIANLISGKEFFQVPSLVDITEELKSILLKLI